MKKLKLKKGNVQLKEPLAFIKDSAWGDYQIIHPDFPVDSRVDGKNITIKNGMIVGLTPVLAERLGLEIVGEKQGETVIEKNNRLDAERKAELIEKFKGSVAAKAVRLMGIRDRYAEGRITKEQRDEQIAGLGLN